MSGHLSGSRTQVLPGTLDPRAGPRGWGAPGEMACDGGGCPGRESKQCQRLMSGNRPGAEGLGRGTAIAHPDRPAGRGWGAGDQSGGKHESRQRGPWRPDPLQRQTDRGKSAAPIPRCGPRGPDCSIVSPIFGPGCAHNAQTVLDKGSWEGAAPGTPALHAGKQESGPFSSLGLGFPIFTRRRRAGVLWAPRPEFPRLPAPCRQPQLPSGSPPFQTILSEPRCLQQA